MNLTTSQCERICEETGAWLVLAAQQPNGSGAALSYTSPHLRLEAMEDTTGIIKQFQRLTKSMGMAKFKDALAIAKELNDQISAREEDRRVAEAAALSHAQLIQEREAEIAQKDELIASFRACLKEL